MCLAGAKRSQDAQRSCMSPAKESDRRHTLGVQHCVSCPCLILPAKIYVFVSQPGEINQRRVILSRVVQFGFSATDDLDGRGKPQRGSRIDDEGKTFWRAASIC